MNNAFKAQKEKKDALVASATIEKKAVIKKRRTDC